MTKDEKSAPEILSQSRMQIGQVQVTFTVGRLSRTKDKPADAEKVKG